jgi:hypothetical protein
MLIFLPVTSAQLSGTCIVAFAYKNLCLLSPTALPSCLVMSVHLRLLAKAPGLLRPSALELATELAELTAAGGPDGVADPLLDEAGDAGADEPIAADTAGGGPLLELVEVHALSNPSATEAAATQVANARRWLR